MRYDCDQCDYQGTQKVKLKTHKLTVHEGVQYTCDYQTCWMTYVCDICKVSFATFHNIKRHMLVHSGDAAYEYTSVEKPYVCQQCVQCFT